MENYSKRGKDNQPEQNWGMDSWSRTLLQTAEICFRESKKMRPELLWLQERFRRIQTKYCLSSRTQTDRFLYERMYGKPPRTTTEYLKIRYWRTGKYTPGSRELCGRLGMALELADQEMKYLIQNYFDRSETVYETEKEWESRECREKCERLEQIIKNYLDETPGQLLEWLGIRPEDKMHCFRHIYYTDAHCYVALYGRQKAERLKRHISSLNYDSEIRRQMKLRGEIPRRTMIRHLILLNASNITLDWINEQLAFFGYLPLCAGHTMPGGECLDTLVIWLLEMYDQVREKEGSPAGLVWFQRTCRDLDHFFKEKGMSRMRFMHFKALEQ